MSSNQTQPTDEQIIVARFEAVKVATAVAERVLLHDYERQVIVNACVLALQTLKQEHDRLVGGALPSEEASEEVSEEASEELPPEAPSEESEEIDISFEESESGE